MAEPLSSLEEGDEGSCQPNCHSKIVSIVMPFHKHNSWINSNLNLIQLKSSLAETYSEIKLFDWLLQTT